MPRSSAPHSGRLHSGVKKRPASERVGMVTDMAGIGTLAIQADLARQGPASPGANITGNVSVGGVTLKYRAFCLLMAPSMSVESRPLETGAWRKLRKEEVDLIA